MNNQDNANDTRPCCLACTTPASHMRRDTSGTKHHSCPSHQRELELYVAGINGWERWLTALVHAA